MDRAVGDLVNLSEDVGGAGGPLPGSVVRSQFVFGFAVFGGVATRRGFWSVLTSSPKYEVGPEHLPKECRKSRQVKPLARD